jgi:uncharacterized phage protein (TIGR01671 family)
MNREIKFRAWDKNLKTWAVDFAVRDNGAIHEFKGGYEGWNMNYDDNNTLALMQYTGLKDKNGKEIYEGDVVKIHNYKDTWKHGEPEIDWRVFEVKHVRYVYVLNNSVISRPLSDYDTRDLEPWDMEVIGNIYENPELLVD